MTGCPSCSSRPPGAHGSSPRRPSLPRRSSSSAGTASAGSRRSPWTGTEAMIDEAADRARIVLAAVGADAVLLLHLAFILFVVAGAALVIRRPRIAWLHLPALAWAV